MPYRRLPAISLLLEDPRLRDAPRPLALAAARAVVAEARAAIARGELLPEALVEHLAERAAAQVLARRTRRLRGVVNATGVVLHTNLGRAPLAPEAVAAVLEVARGYSNAELDLKTGRRGGRLEGVTSLVAALTGAEAALVVNNNAAAALLALTGLAAGREVVISRGELVEIGGSFRVPDVIASGGARLVEVGTTNRTRVADYAAAIGPDTALLMRVHPSNFRMLGFTERPDRGGLVALARARGLPLFEDLGSGALGPPLQVSQVDFDWAEADPVADVLGAGVDLVCFSGDKLLGGPQAGILAGRAALIEALRAHPLYRALRMDKLGLAALEATLLLYLEGRADAVPARALLSRDAAACRAVAERIAAAVPGATVEDDVGYSGGGALPARGLPTAVVAVRGGDPDARAAQLRDQDPPVIARVARDALLLDPRTLLPGDEEVLTAALARIVAAGKD